MEIIITDIISYPTETHELLPTQHYGGRPRRSAEDEMIILSESIHKAWKEKTVYTALYMDVAGDFNNVHHEQLTHNLKKRLIPEAITKWISSFLHNRSTQLQFNWTKSNRIPTPARIPQGSPLSPLLYEFTTRISWTSHNAKEQTWASSTTWCMEYKEQHTKGTCANSSRYYKRSRNEGKNTGHNSKHPSIYWSTIPTSYSSNLISS